MEITGRVIAGVGALILALVALISYFVYDKFFKQSEQASATLDEQPEFKVKDEKILITSGDQLHEVVKKSDESGVTVFFGHHQCGHCLECIGRYEEAAGDNAGDSVFIAEYGAVGDEIDKYDIKGFPTIIKFKNGGENKEEFMGDRSVDAFKAFMDK